MSNRPIKIDVHNKWAKRIYDQWQQIDTLKSHAAELYKCDRCLGMEITYKWNLGMCPEELCGLLNCHPEHKEGIQAYLATDATPEQGGIAFYTKTGWQKCFYYQPDFSELGIRIDPAKPTEFEMINLLVALFIFKREILNHKTVRIIVDNNFLRTRAKSQRHALTEAIAAILESCDLFGCTINELFHDNVSADEPFMKVADRLSRNKEIKQWLTEKDENWNVVRLCDYNEIPQSRKNLINDDFVASINGILQNTRGYFIPESADKFRRLERMTIQLELLENEFLLRRQQYYYNSPQVYYNSPQITYTPSLPEESNWFWTKVLLFCLLGYFFAKFIGAI